jgi:hypothetical protein
MFRWLCHQDVDWNGAVVADREADFAIVIGQCRRGRGDRCRQCRAGPVSLYVKGSWVMMPAAQNGLQQDRKCADERAASVPLLSSATEPNPYGEAHPHFDPMCPRLYPPNAAIGTRVCVTI